MAYSPYAFQTGGAGLMNTTSWNSSSVRSSTAFTRLRNYGNIIQVSKSPFFPQNGRDYERHVAEWNVWAKEEEQSAMKRKLSGAEAMRKSRVKVSEILFFLLWTKIWIAS